VRSSGSQPDFLQFVNVNSRSRSPVPVPYVVRCITYVSQREISGFVGEASPRIYRVRKHGSLASLLTNGPVSHGGSLQRERRRKEKKKKKRGNSPLNKTNLSPTRSANTSPFFPPPPPLPPSLPAALDVVGLTNLAARKSGRVINEEISRKR